MFGIRTPVKLPGRKASPDPEKTPDPTTKAGPSDQASGVRRSIGEWEAGKTVTKRKAQTTPNKAGPAPAVNRFVLSQAGESPPVPTKTKYANRTAEGRACLNAAKQQLGSARNLKTDIKNEVTKSVERLYQLIKEAEAEKADRKRDQGEGQETGENIEKSSDLPLPSSISTRRESEAEKALVERMEEHSRLIKENSEQMVELKQVIEKSQKTLEGVSYASVAAQTARRQPPGQTALHSVVITSKDETETGDEVLDRIRTVIKAKEGGITMDRVRKARDRKIIIGCKTEEERRKLRERLTKAEGQLQVEDIKNKDPLLLLRDVLQYNTDEDILKALRSQNRGVFLGLENHEDRIEIRYRKKTRNPQTSHVVVRVSPKIWARSIEAGAVHIDLQKVRVVDQSPLVQCSLCLAYGHGRRFCNQTVEKCSHCGGPHMRSECADWRAGGTPTCCNCTHAKMDFADHNAFSQECEVRRKWDALARSTIAYC